MSNETPLYRARRRAGLSQTQLAELSGVMQCAISRIERGGKPSLSNAESLARVLEISELEILYPERYPAPVDQVAA